MKPAICAAAAAMLTICAAPAMAGDPAGQPGLELLGTYASGLFDEGGAEIPTYDPLTRRAFVVNAGETAVDVLDLRDPRQPAKLAGIAVKGDIAHKLGISEDAVGNANSVDVRLGLLAVAVEAVPKQDDGWVAIYSTFTLKLLGVVPVGALPDMVTFAPTGLTVLTANEGEPNDLYDVDPHGSVSIVDLLRWGRKGFVRTVGFEEFNAGGPRAHELPAEVRIFGPGASVAQDLEPEFITIDGNTAYVTLQENNALAVIDIRRARVEKIVALGFKDHSLPGNALDASDRDDPAPGNNGIINIANWPVLGMYQPDSIDSFSVRGRTYLITANEGDARVYPTADLAGGPDEGDVFNEEDRIKDLELDPVAFSDAAALQSDLGAGRLNVTNTLGDIDGDGDFDQLYAFGARSFSIWDARSGTLVFDSGDELERIIANLLPADFNSTNDENGSFDNRSDNKGPEPEGLAVGYVNGTPYAFIGLERIGGVMVYDLSDPEHPLFVDYVNNRDFSLDAEECSVNPVPGAACDLGPEGIKFVPAWASPTHSPLVIVGNEISGTTSIYEFRAPRSKDRRR